MRPFQFDRAADAAQARGLGAATGRGEVDAPVQYLAGGTSLLDLMKLDVLTPGRLVDIRRLAGVYGGIDAKPDGVRIGALATMAAVADEPVMVRDYPAIAQSLQLAASAQLRNMATLGGNVLQKTRCAYYRDPSWGACNKRKPGSGCTAIDAPNRNHAVLGTDQACIAQYPGDLGVALVALDATVELLGQQGVRTIAFADLHRPADGHPHIETSLRPGDIIIAVFVPAGAWTRRSVYLKIRDRASYEFALASAAVALSLEGDTVREARIGLGGVAYRPWRAREAEAQLVGRRLTPASAEAAARIALADAITHGANDYKPELSRRTLVRALLQAQAMEV